MRHQIYKMDRMKKKLDNTNKNEEKKLYFFYYLLWNYLKNLKQTSHILEK